jgi:hypothetical protein
MAGKSVLEGFRSLLAAGGLPDLGPGPREGVMPQKELMARLDSLMRDAKLPPNSSQLGRGLILLWHDHMEPAHEIAREIENADGSFLHGIVHRREPDYGNAAYWFRRVGSHAAFPKITEAVSGLLKSRNRPDLQAELVPHGEWDPFVFIRLCEKAGDRSDGEVQTELLREIQGLESNALLDYWLNA